LIHTCELQLGDGFEHEINLFMIINLSYGSS